MNTLGLYLKPSLFELLEFSLDLIDVSTKIKDNFGSQTIFEICQKLKIGLVNFVENKDRFNMVNDYILSLGMA